MPTLPGIFRPAGWRPARQANDQERGSARSRGYNHRWDLAAAAFKQGHPICLGCQAVGRTAPATVVDHIIPHKGDRELFWDPANWQGGCDWHHNVVKQRLETELAAGRLTPADMKFDSDAAKRLTLSIDP